MKMIKKHFPSGWDEERVRRVLAHYETQTEEAVAQDERAFRETGRTVIEIPVELMPVIREVIAQYEAREPVLSLKKLLENSERMTFYVYKSEDRIVGVAALQTESEETGRLHRVYILPGHQRRGIGIALVTHLERKAREMRLRRLLT